MGNNSSSTAKSVAVLYHKADLDGVLSGIIAKKYISPRREIVDLYPADYNQIPDAFHEKAHSYDEIYMIDFSDDAIFNDEILQKKVIWIDHHIHAINKKPQVRQFCIDGVAACRLAFQFFTNLDYSVLQKSHFQNRAVSEPAVLTLAGEYDIWDDTSPFAKPFNFGTRLIFEEVEELLTKTFTVTLDRNKNDDVDILLALDHTYAPMIIRNIERGEGGISVVKETSRKLDGGSPVTLLGHKGVAFNTHIKSSLIHENKEDEEFTMSWNTLPKNNAIAKVSLYSEKIDVGKIASTFGGGGHKGAAGFEMKTTELLTLLISHERLS